MGRMLCMQSENSPDSNRVDPSEAFGTNLHGKSTDFESRTVYSQIIENKPAERRNGSAGFVCLFTINYTFFAKMVALQAVRAGGRFSKTALSVIGIKDIFESAFVDFTGCRRFCRIDGHKHRAGFSGSQQTQRLMLLRMEKLESSVALQRFVRKTKRNQLLIS